MLEILQSVKQADSSHDYGDKPLAVIQRTMQYGTDYAPDFMPADVVTQWDNLFRDSNKVFTSLSTNSHFIRSTSQSHFLQQKTEDLVGTLKALDWVLQQLN
jgi:hypothetical protein